MLRQLQLDSQSSSMSAEYADAAPSQAASVNACRTSNLPASVEAAEEFLLWAQADEVVRPYEDHKISLPEKILNLFAWHIKEVFGKKGVLKSQYIKPNKNSG